ncbi:MAG: helix-turn-helix domain-containing protein [Bacteroides sp.]|nr:helix-turn-helix domain-containing protein [Eubacterium sp.]MCM1419330.1 helix-turn-helix domain-containing protein [Roseburia sp.]MCM1462030.1 helix-turn-helix domain-containing protein [Bacteroides sp.]
MNIEIANRLVQLRKEKGLSQEQLAEKIGVSRQAVSKWERSEASPDTDNLIMLARLYSVSLDELLRTDDEIPLPDSTEKAEEAGEDDPAEKAGTGEGDPSQKERARDKIKIGDGGVRLVAKNGDIISLGRGGLRLIGDDPATAERERLLRRKVGCACTVAVILLMSIGVGISTLDRSRGAALLSLAPFPFLMAFLGRERKWVRVLYTIFVAVGAFAFMSEGGMMREAFGGLCFLLIPLYYRFVAFLRLRAERVKTEKPAPALSPSSSAHPLSDFFVYHEAAIDLLIYAGVWLFTAAMMLSGLWSTVYMNYILLCLIPILRSFARAIRERDPDRFSAEALMLFLWLLSAFGGYADHRYAMESFPVLFLAPLYHFLCRRFNARFAVKDAEGTKEDL